MPSWRKWLLRKNWKDVRKLDAVTRGGNFLHTENSKDLRWEHASHVPGTQSAGMVRA